MTGQPLRLSGNEWQSWASLLLATHYGPTEYQAVPDNHKGDAGIEGFTVTEGHAYQAYGCEEPLETQVRYERQRNKMTDDIRKFIDNRVILQSIFGRTIITRWTLFVPFFDSRELVIHANRKTTEVRDAGLPYVGDMFRVTVCDEEHFRVARNQLINSTTDRLELRAEPATGQQVTEWAAENDVLLNVLDGKLRRLPTLPDDVARKQFRNSVLKWYLEGQSLLEALRRYPHVYERVVKAKSHQENYLAMAAATIQQSPADILKTALDTLRETFEREVKQLSVLSADSLVHEAVADWLLRCPLSFPETVHA